MEESGIFDSFPEMDNIYLGTPIKSVFRHLSATDTTSLLNFDDA